MYCRIALKSALTCSETMYTVESIFRSSYIGRNHAYTFTKMLLGGNTISKLYALICRCQVGTDNFCYS